MKYVESHLKGVVLIEPDCFQDRRGFFMESYNELVFQKLGFPYPFVQDNHSFSSEPGVLRGLHYQLGQKAQAKLVRVISGAIYDVVVDISKNSPTFGQWEGFILTAYNRKQLLVPKGFAHGFCTLVPQTEVLYKVDAFYSPQYERGIRWDDPSLKIDWPYSNPILSNKDSAHPLLHDAEVTDEGEGI